MDAKLLNYPAVRGMVGVAGAFIFLATAWCALLTGASRLLSDYGVRTGNLTAAETSIRMTPRDPQAHVSRADLLSSNLGVSESYFKQEAVRSYRNSVGLRPLDYALWMSLGQALEDSGEMEEARRAFTEDLFRRKLARDPGHHARLPRPHPERLPHLVDGGAR